MVFHTVGQTTFVFLRWRKRFGVLLPSPESKQQNIRDTALSAQSANVINIWGREETNRGSQGDLKKMRSPRFLHGLETQKWGKF